jgi:hypothetical protein
MGAELRRQLILGVIALALAGGIYTAWPTSTAVEPTSTPSARGTSANTPKAATPTGVTAPDVHLRALDSDRPKPGAEERDLFRFRVKPPPPPPVRARLESAPAVPTGPPPPPPLPPIAFKFIGLVETADQGAKIAVLSDGKNVFHGREGDIIEGRYRILRIGVESIEMAYLDGRGRQTIRLSGS